MKESHAMTKELSERIMYESKWIMKESHVKTNESGEMIKYEYK